ncbi:Endonuclease/exonuclease/phosphatase [Phlyctochytrium arcticum]|nr:Endonuclease/exonuclease/phosphatase [Phlyctochytrium arcticum]
MRLGNLLTLILPGIALAETISEIQGPAHFGMDGKTVKQVRGVVTMKKGSNFWIQDPKGDGNDNTSDGVYVYVPTANSAMSPIAAKLAVGDEVEVDARVKEFANNEYPTELFLTELDMVTAIKVVGKGTVAPTLLGKGGREAPKDTVFWPFLDGPAGDKQTPTDQAFFKTYKDFSPKTKGLDFYESLEGMLVTVKKPVVTGQPYQGMFWALPDLGEGATGRNAAGGITMSQSAKGNDNNPERVLIGAPASGKHPVSLAIGDEVSDITGVVTYEKGQYKIIPTAAVSLVKENTNVMPAAPATPAAEFSVASYNMENLGGDAPDSKYKAIAEQIVKYLGSPAIFVANEIQDNDGASASGVVASDLVVKRIVETVRAAGGPTYKATWIDPEDKKDGGQPGGNIRSVIFYNEAAGVKLSEGTAGGPNDAVKVIKDKNGKPALSLNPGRIEPSSSAWDASRKPLVASFEIAGERVFVVGNHFSSKGGSSSTYGAVQPPIQGAGEKRIAQAELNRKLAEDILKIDPTAKVAILGDLNDFAWTTAIQTLLGTVSDKSNPILFDLAEETLPAEERYSYNFDGQSQELDHFVVSKALLADLTTYVPVHINTWGPFAARTSDHDPQYARFKRVGGQRPRCSHIYRRQLDACF